MKPSEYLEKIDITDWREKEKFDKRFVDRQEQLKKVDKLKKGFIENSMKSIKVYEAVVDSMREEQ